MSNIKIDHEAFYRRIRRLYSAWKENGFEELSKMDVFVVAMGTDDDIPYSKSIAVQTWLFGYELSDTIMMLTENAIFFLASKKKIDFLRKIEANLDSAVPPVKLLVRDKVDNDKRNFERLTEAIKESRKGKTIGCFLKDAKFSSAFLDGWRAHLAKLSFSSVDVSNAVAYTMAVKEESEVSVVKKACQVTLDVFSKYLKEQIMDIIDNDKKVKHIKIAEGVENAIQDKKYSANLDATQLDLCYPAIIQSGGSYKLKFSVVSDKENVHFGAIICSFGARYKSYCSNIVRTFLVNPSEKIQSVYELLVSAEEHILSALKDGAKLSDVYTSTVSIVKKNNPDLVNKLTKNFGFAMGIEFREGSLSIAPNCNSVVKKGMLFNVNIGLAALHNRDASDDKGKEVALFIGDSVLVNDNAPATLLTSSKKKIKNIAIFLKDADESEDEEKENSLPRPQNFGRGRRTAVIEQKLRQDTTAEEKRKQHQKDLMHKMNEEALERIKSGGISKEQEKVRRAPVSYKSPGQLPRESEVRELKIYVDKKYETIILPIFGVPVPFHIAVIKNISQSVEGDYTYLRINFFHPGASIGKDGGGGYATNPDASFLKELTYRSTNVKEPGELSAPSSNLNTAFRLIKDIQKKYKTREAEEKEKANLVEQDSLVINPTKGYPKLKDLYIRPNIVQKRLSGVLEAHVNGLRYTSIRGDKVDILYNNIKHAFYQSCDGEMIILLHFHLKNAIMFGKKRHVDVQFYTEVGEITTDLGKHQHMHDRDDLAAEQQERELRHKLKQAFKGFCEKVEGVTKSELEFDSPFRELGFHGVPFRETVLLQPTSACLVNLTAWPPMVITLEDVQLVHFERVQFHLKNFDMVFVFKDYNKRVMMICSIPMNMLDHVKEWLNSADIKYTEGIQSLNWPKIMKTIVDDPEGFFESGGWNFLDPDSGSEEEDDDEDTEDEEFKVSGDSESFDDESDEDYTSSDASADEDIDEELDSDESSGKDWSDLEREAAEDDADKSDEDRRGGGARMHAGGKHKHHKHKSPEKKSSSKGRHRDGRDGHSGSKHSSEKRKRDSSGSSKHHHHHKAAKKSKR